MATDQIARGIAAKTAATVRAQSIAIEEFGATGAGNDRAAVQRAIDTAVARKIPRITNGLHRLELWEPVRTGNVLYGNPPSFYAARTLSVPACASLDIDFGGARITLKGPTGGNRFPGQTVSDGVWLGGFMTLAGVIGRLRLANVDVDGGFTGDTLNQVDFNPYDKGIWLGDLADQNLGFPNGCGTVIMENVSLHGFAGEIMYDNSFREHFSRDCHFYNSGHSCWNPNGLGRVVAHNVQAGIARTVAEVVGGKGHTYIGGRFYNSGPGGSTFIGGPDPTLGLIAYNEPIRREDAPPPFVQFIGTRFDDIRGFLYFGCYMRGSIVCVDTPIFLASGFASYGELKDIQLDITSWADRNTAFSAVQIGGAGADDSSKPKSIDLRIRTGRTELAADNGRYMAAALTVGGWIGANCSIQVSGAAHTAFAASTPAGATLPLIDTTGFRQTGNSDYLYFDSNQTFTIASRSVNLYPTAAGTFDFILNTAPGYTSDQLFTFYYGGGATDRIVSFAQNGAGMKLNATRTLRRAGEYLTLRRSDSGAVWVEHAYMGQGA